MHSMPSVVVVSGAWTPIGRDAGSLSEVDAFELGATALRAKLAHDLAERDLQTGMVTMCIGGGQALAAIFERC